MIDPDTPAFPAVDTNNYGETFHHVGLTKREYFAALAMQGILSGDPDFRCSADQISNAAIAFADSLISKLSK